MVYQDRELPRLMYRDGSDGIKLYMGKKKGWVLIEDEEYLDMVLSKIGDSDECRILSDEDAEEFIEKYFK